ncbi:cytochrome c biogenesis CcdA family protein [Dactylosporangium sp. CA-092794]|uniref:cytochrome c biogenesis CcdA family protein n=1 Tax=Dactylosporangium sp. CA-092794 TaxID=3239929 RepID=UPI003D8A47A6
MVLLALAAGVLAAVNPCGFALLPAYLSLLVLDEGVSRRRAVGRALLLTLAMTAGFVGVFGLVGIVLTPAVSWLPARLPWFTIGFGLLLVALGGWLAAGRHLPALPWRPARAPALTRSLPSMVLFGAAYALASLSCTIGPFLAIVASSLESSAITLFLAYAAGMGLVVGAAALAVALLRASLLTRVRRAGPALSRTAGALVLLAGAYVAYYGWYEVRLAADGPRALRDPVVRAAGTVQQWLAGGLDTAGVAAVSVVFAALLVAGLAVGRRRAG